MNIVIKRDYAIIARRGVALCSLAIALAVVDLNGCAPTTAVIQLSNRAAASNAGIASDDRDALDQGNLGFIRDKYAKADWNNLPVEQLSLLCDVLLKYGEYDGASTCLDTYERRIEHGEGTRDRSTVGRMLSGKRALIALALGNPGLTRSLLTNADDQGSQYVRGLADIQLAHRLAPQQANDALVLQYNSEARAIADRLALQFDPAPVYYAASLYAASGDCQRSLDLLNDPERRLLRNYGLVSSKNFFGSDVQTKPFRLDIFGEFSFGWFGKTAFAPAANVYVEYLAARCLRELHRDAEARVRYDALLVYPYIQAYRDVYWRALYDRAQLAIAQGDEATVSLLLQKSIEVIESVRSFVSTEQDRIAFFDDKQDVYAKLIELLIRQGQPKRALEYVERSRSRALVDLLSSRRQIGASPEARSLVVENDRAEEKLNTVSFHDPSGIETQIAAVEKEHERIRRSAPDLAPLVTVPPVMIDEIRSRLSSDEAAIVYFKSSQKWWAFVLERDSLAVQPLASGSIEADALAFQSVLTKPRHSGSLAEGQMLYKDLMETPLQGLHAKRLVIVPTDVLHHVAMAALHDGSRYLIERYAINVVPSLSTFVLPQKPTTGEGGLIIGNPNKGGEYNLPAAESEARAIATSAPGSKLLIGPEATIDALRSDAGGHRFFHFAGHGILDQNDPLNSGLFLAPSSGGVELLTAGDLYNMQLPVELAVLSGCETGLGQITTGDDVIGVLRGFLYAGPRTVVGSLWKIDDNSTMELMKAFYRAYLSGQDPPEALRNAQLVLINQRRPPFYWASFFATSIQG
ncbi:MAG: CHAT domain-containing protein [Rhizomicrobium sp.]